mmetsp:Transcript_16338/g.35323  ORF Transcript_16338/g.35323 Transcript_16338/m.35323 type:complete len:99 (+) Transcript_16338:386-682(+)
MCAMVLLLMPTLRPHPPITRKSAVELAGRSSPHSFDSHIHSPVCVLLCSPAHARAPHHLLLHGNVACPHDYPYVYCTVPYCTASHCVLWFTPEFGPAP